MRRLWKSKNFFYAVFLLVTTRSLPIYADESHQEEEALEATLSRENLSQDEQEILNYLSSISQYGATSQGIEGLIEQIRRVKDRVPKADALIKKLENFVQVQKGLEGCDDSTEDSEGGHTAIIAAAMGQSLAEKMMHSMYTDVADEDDETTAKNIQGSEKSWHLYLNQALGTQFDEIVDKGSSKVLSNEEIQRKKKNRVQTEDGADHNAPIYSQRETQSINSERAAILEADVFHRIEEKLLMDMYSFDQLLGHPLGLSTRKSPREYIEWKRRSDAYQSAFHRNISRNSSVDGGTQYELHNIWEKNSDKSPFQLADYNRRVYDFIRADLAAIHDLRNYAQNMGQLANVQMAATFPEDHYEVDTRSNRVRAVMGYSLIPGMAEHRLIEGAYNSSNYGFHSVGGANEEFYSQMQLNYLADKVSVFFEHEIFGETLEGACPDLREKVLEALELSEEEQVTYKSCLEELKKKSYAFADHILKGAHIERGKFDLYEHLIQMQNPETKKPDTKTEYQKNSEHILHAYNTWTVGGFSKEKDELGLAAHYNMGTYYGSEAREADELVTKEVQKIHSGSYAPLIMTLSPERRMDFVKGKKDFSEEDYKIMIRSFIDKSEDTYNDLLERFGRSSMGHAPSHKFLAETALYAPKDLAQTMFKYPSFHDELCRTIQTHKSEILKNMGPDNEFWSNVNMIGAAGTGVAALLVGLFTGGPVGLMVAAGLTIASGSFTANDLRLRSLDLMLSQDHAERQRIFGLKNPSQAAAIEAEDREKEIAQKGTVLGLHGAMSVIPGGAGVLARRGFAPLAKATLDSGRRFYRHMKKNPGRALVYYTTRQAKPGEVKRLFRPNAPLTRSNLAHFFKTGKLPEGVTWKQILFSVLHYTGIKGLDDLFIDAPAHLLTKNLSKRLLQARVGNMKSVIAGGFAYTTAILSTKSAFVEAAASEEFQKHLLKNQDFYKNQYENLYIHKALNREDQKPFDEMSNVEKARVAVAVDVGNAQFDHQADFVLGPEARSVVEKRMSSEADYDPSLMLLEASFLKMLQDQKSTAYKDLEKLPGEMRHLAKEAFDYASIFPMEQLLGVLEDLEGEKQSGLKKAQFEKEIYLIMKSYFQEAKALREVKTLDELAQVGSRLSGKHLAFEIYQSMYENGRLTASEYRNKLDKLLHIQSLAEMAEVMNLGFEEVLENIPIAKSGEIERELNYISSRPAGLASKQSEDRISIILLNQALADGGVLKQQD